MQLLHFRPSIAYLNHIMSARHPISLTSSPSSSASTEEDMAPPCSVEVPELTKSVSLPAAALAPVKAPEGFNNNYCYGLLTLADKQVASNRTMSEKYQRNISRLAESAVSLNIRMKAQERRGIKG
jgi:LAS superfamily LD-carboxypeptidase LdcB